MILRQTQAKILNRLLTLAHGNEQAEALLNSAYWQAMPAHKFSFAVAGFLQMPPETAQSLLEVTDAQQRLDSVLEIINSIGPIVH